MQFESCELAGVTEEGFDEGPIDGVVAGEAEEVVEGAEGRPDALGVDVPDLGVNNEVGDEMLGGWEADEEIGVIGESEGLGVGDDFGGGEDARGKALTDGAVEFNADVAFAEHGGSVVTKASDWIDVGGLGRVACVG